MPVTNKSQLFTTRALQRLCCLALALLLLLLFPRSPLYAWAREGYNAIAILAEQRLKPSVEGKVASILDGDTIEVLHNTHPERIRLNGIDCPEKGQSYGKRAKQAASKLVFGKDVTLETHGTDKYGRTIADVLLPDGTNVNHELVKDGWCWWYRKYAPGNTELEKLEKEARAAKKGLWADPQPVPPWVYRKAKRGQWLDFSDMVPLEGVIEENASSRGPPLLDATEAASPFAIVGNRRSHIYHRPDCPNYSQIALHNRVPFDSAAGAEAAGYRKARNCP